MLLELVYIFAISIYYMFQAIGLAIPLAGVWLIVEAWFGLLG